jgi:hypothetical protein
MTRIRWYSGRRYRPDEERARHEALGNFEGAPIRRHLDLVKFAVFAVGVPDDLNTLIDPRDPLKGQLNLFFAKSINNRGNIVVNGTYQSGPKHNEYDIFLLTPVAAGKKIPKR